MAAGRHGEDEPVTPPDDRILKFLVSRDGTLTDILRQIDANRGGIALIVDAEGRLLATATDGDMRRAMLHRVELGTPIRRLLDDGHVGTDFASAPEGASVEEIVAVMNSRHVRHVPILNGAGRVIDIALRDEIAHFAEPEEDLGAVIMAGGFGTRLRPLTHDTPKPMLPVGGKPLIERTIDHMSESGIRSVRIATHYLKDKISDHLGDGTARGMELSYVDEEKPMGTAGSLRLMARPTGPTLIINGDVLTDLDFRAMHGYHRQHGALMTMAVRDYALTVPYGVVESDGVHVRRVVEKPRHDYFINAGIYILEPAAIDLIPEGTRFDMTDLVDALLAKGESVASFPLREYWLDIGSQEDYAKAELDIEAGKVRTS
jgi:dTDP-glucose pyrophosphorylase